MFIALPCTCLYQTRVYRTPQYSKEITVSPNCQRFWAQSERQQAEGHCEGAVVQVEVEQLLNSGPLLEPQGARRRGPLLIEHSSLRQPLEKGGGRCQRPRCILIRQVDGPVIIRMTHYVLSSHRQELTISNACSINMGVIVIISIRIQTTPRERAWKILRIRDPIWIIKPGVRCNVVKNQYMLFHSFIPLYYVLLTFHFQSYATSISLPLT